MIEQVESTPEFGITLHTRRYKNGEKAYYAYHRNKQRYLHSDGALYQWTAKSGTIWTGYFSTIEEVKEAIELYNKLNAK